MEILKRTIKIKITIFVVIVLVILTAFAAILDGIDSKDKEYEKIKTHYENMIYKGGSLPIPYPQDYVVLTSYFSPNRVNPLTGKLEAHRGIDIVSKKDSEILAVADGIVTVLAYDEGGYGNWIEIEHIIEGKTFRTRYGHMRDVPLVKEGESVIARNCNWYSR